MHVCHVQWVRPRLGSLAVINLIVGVRLDTVEPMDRPVQYALQTPSRDQLEVERVMIAT
jgi:hypothetical protein